MKHIWQGLYEMTIWLDREMNPWPMVERTSALTAELSSLQMTVFPNKQLTLPGLGCQPDEFNNILHRYKERSPPVQSSFRTDAKQL